MPFYLYILECSNSNYYIGYTTDIKRRYQEHCAGSAKCKYTRSFPPKRLAGCWQFDNVTVNDILSLEKRLKQLTKIQKQKLVLQPKLLAEYSDLFFKIFSL